MAFLDNSGDIILDAVLTDTGRMRLARGDGSFRIAKYAFGDDEIDYANFNPNHASGSAYYDLEILQTPVLEAFTNNTATMKSNLISLSNNNLLYLPVMVLNTYEGYKATAADGIASGSHAVLVDNDSLTKFGSGGTSEVTSYMNGYSPTANTVAQSIRVDQGLNTNELSSDQRVDPELKETQYIIEMDNRLGSLVTHDGSGATPAFIDDDSIASYYVSGAPWVENTPRSDQGTDSDNPAAAAITGPRGTNLRFKIRSSVSLRSSTFLFDQIGSSGTYEGTAFLYIDSTIRVRGATTGYRIDIPVRFIKDNS